MSTLKRFQVIAKSMFDARSEHFIPNPLTGGDDDVIILDMVSKEWTFAENGTNLASQDWIDENQDKTSIQKLIIADLESPSFFSEI
jgi:hypothetical protein